MQALAPLVLSRPPANKGFACEAADAAVRVALEPRGALVALRRLVVPRRRRFLESVHGSRSVATRFRVRTKPLMVSPASSAGSRMAPTMSTSTHSGTLSPEQGSTSFTASFFVKSPRRSVLPGSSLMATVLTSTRRYSVAMAAALGSSFAAGQPQTGCRGGSEPGSHRPGPGARDGCRSRRRRETAGAGRLATSIHHSGCKSSARRVSRLTFGRRAGGARPRWSPGQPTKGKAALAKAPRLSGGTGPMGFALIEQPPSRGKRGRGRGRGRRAGPRQDAGPDEGRTVPA